MEFKDYVNSLPNEREQTIMDLAKICRVSNSTVYRWLRGDFMPDPLKRKVIADYLRKSEKELFPMCDECRNCKFHRNCINGLYCLKLKEYVQYSNIKKCQSKKKL